MNASGSPVHGPSSKRVRILRTTPGLSKPSNGSHGIERVSTTVRSGRSTTMYSCWRVALIGASSGGTLAGEYVTRAGAMKWRAGRLSERGADPLRDPLGGLDLLAPPVPRPRRVVHRDEGDEPVVAGDRD